jgi:radical SAM superfamily enzyme|tara:strand:+ start:587 stop:895 length:309 start_codon:yes stop_codon:yes gene_type:complete
MTTDGIDFDKAMLDPGSVFDTPEEVATRPDLTLDQKIEILRRWAYDASELAVAEEEGMITGEQSLLARVLKELDRLGDGYDSSHTPPTKHGGISRSSIRPKK